MWLFAYLLAARAFAGDLSFAPATEAASTVRWTEAGTTVVLETFPATEAVVGSGVSHDGRWAFAWHQPKGKSLRVSVYDLQAKTRGSSFAPGVGGSLDFTPGNTLLLSYGCGTSCQSALLYDVRGNKLMSEGGAIGSVSPSLRYALFYPDDYSDARSVDLFDLSTGQRLSAFGPTADGSLAVKAVRWGPADAFVVVTVGPRDPLTGAARYLRMAQDGTVTWVEGP